MSESRAPAGAREAGVSEEREEAHCVPSDPNVWLVEMAGHTLRVIIRAGLSPAIRRRWRVGAIVPIEGAGEGADLYVLRLLRLDDADMVSEEQGAADRRVDLIPRARLVAWLRERAEAKEATGELVGQVAILNIADAIEQGDAP